MRCSMPCSESIMLPVLVLVSAKTEVIVVALQPTRHAYCSLGELDE